MAVKDPVTWLLWTRCLLVCVPLLRFVGICTK